MTRHTNLNLPKTNLFRTVYIGKRNGRTYRVARCALQMGRWRLDVHTMTGWESNVAKSYPTRNAALYAFKALGGDNATA